MLGGDVARFEAGAADGVLRRDYACGGPPVPVQHTPTQATRPAAALPPGANPSADRRGLLTQDYQAPARRYTDVLPRPKSRPAAIGRITREVFAGYGYEESAFP